MTWRWWQRNEYDDGTSDVTSYLMPLLYVPVPDTTWQPGAFLDYSVGTPVVFVVRWYDTDANNIWTEECDTVEYMQALLASIIADEFVIINITTQPATTTEPPTIEEGTETP